MNKDQLVFYEVNNSIATIYLNNRPANALNSKVIKALEDNIDELNNDDTIYAIIITGKGKMFAAGADIKEFTKFFGNPEKGVEMAKKAHSVFRKIEQSKKPVIAAINGACLGGGLELAMSCHIRIASDEALLGQPETNLGLIPGFGGTQRLSRLVNPAKALELTILGGNIKGKEAERIGLVNLSTSLENLMDKANEWSNKIARSKSSHTIEKLLNAVYRPINGMDQDMDGLNYEAVIFGELFSTPDTQEGVNAFIEKRTANYMR